MEKIKHNHVGVRGLNLHVADIGSGPDVLLLHGFPEIWYSWRYQMVALANAGYHAIAPDFRGYGLSDQPSEPEKSTFVDLVEDLIGLLDALGIQKDPGRAEADFGRFDVKSVVRNIYTLFSGTDLPVAEEGKEIMDLFDPSTPLPNWFTEDDLKIYASLYEKSGFGFPLQVPYRCMARTLEQLSNLTDYRVQAPNLLIMGTKDYVLKLPGMEPYINSEILKANVPNLEIKFISDGSHFVQEQFPEEVNKLLLDFFKQLL